MAATVTPLKQPGWLGWTLRDPEGDPVEDHPGVPQWDPQGGPSVAALWQLIINYWVPGPKKSPKSTPRDPPENSPPQSLSFGTKHSKTIKTLELFLGLIRWKDGDFQR